MSSSAGSDSASGGGREAYGASGQYGSASNSRESYGGGGQYTGGGYDGSQTADDGFIDTVSVVDTGDLGTEQANIAANIAATTYTPDNTREQYLATQYPTLTQAEIEKGITETGEILDEKVQRESLVEKALNLYQKYSPLGMVINLGGSLIDSLGTASKSLQNKAIAFDIQNKLEKAYQDPIRSIYTRCKCNTIRTRFSKS